MELESVHHLHPGRLTREAASRLIAWACVSAMMVLGLGLLVAWMFMNTPPPQG